MTYDAETEDLVGGTDEPSERVRRYREAQAAKNRPPANTDIGNVANGVTAYWLATALRSSVGTVRVKLAKCPYRKVGSLMVYDLGEAMEYLIKPKVDIENYLKNLKKDDLPDVLRESYWSALLKRQQWEINAKDLWHTEDVMAVFGETMQTIKFAIKLWIDDMEREVPITPAQYRFLVQKCDELQDAIYKKLVEQHATKATKSSAGRHAPEESQEEDFGGLV
jgi:hypothetical protein